MKTCLSATVAVVGLVMLPTLTQAQVGGNLVQYPATDLFLEITTGPNGDPVLSVEEFELVTGDYYRLNINCPDVTDDLAGWRLEVPELLRNSHLRLVSVGDVEIHLQGLMFHAIECDEAASARFGFVPLRPGTYELYVGNVPTAVGRPPGEAGVQSEGRYIRGRFIVE